jgi:SAM-dependent methyltransferase
MSPGWRRRLWHAFVRARIPFKAALVKGYLRALERKRSSGLDSAAADRADGIAVPGARLRVLVNGIPELDWFLASGRAQANYLRSLLAEAGKPLDQMESILDFGCGCGRITRWWAREATSTRVYGCDYNEELVRWCRSNLPFVDVERNDLIPPLPYGDDSFDFVYAFSVFTHLSIDLGRAWMDELKRVVKPGGLIWFTVHGRSYRDRLPAEHRKQFDDGEIVVWFPEIEGTNLCAAYWPQEAVRGMLGDRVQLLRHLDPEREPARAQAAQIAPHDSYLVRVL